MFLSQKFEHFVLFNNKYIKAKMDHKWEDSIESVCSRQVDDISSEGESNIWLELLLLLSLFCMLFNWRRIAWILKCSLDSSRYPL